MSTTKNYLDYKKSEISQNCKKLSYNYLQIFTCSFLFFSLQIFSSGLPYGRDMRLQINVCPSTVTWSSLQNWFKNVTLLYFAMVSTLTLTDFCNIWHIAICNKQWRLSLYIDGAAAPSSKFGEAKMDVKRNIIYQKSSCFNSKSVSK